MTFVGDIDYEIKFYGSYGTLSSKVDVNSIHKSGSSQVRMIPNTPYSLNITAELNANSSQIEKMDKVAILWNGETLLHGYVRDIDDEGVQDAITIFCECACCRMADRIPFDMVYLDPNVVNKTIHAITLGANYTTSLTNPVKPLSSVKVLDTTEKCLTQQNDIVNNPPAQTYYDVYNDVGGVLFFEARCLIPLDSYIHRIALYLRNMDGAPAGGTALDHQVTIYSASAPGTPLWTYNITDSDIPGDGSYHWLILAVDLPSQGTQAGYIELKANTISGARLRWAYSQHNEFASPLTNGNGQVIEDGFAGWDWWFIGIPGANNQRGYFLYEVEYERDWKKISSYNYTIDWTTGIITWGGTNNFTPSFDNKTREVVAGTTYDISKFSHLSKSAAYNSVTLFEAVVNDFLRGDDDFYYFNIPAVKSYNEWYILEIQQRDLLSVLRDIVFRDKLEFHCEERDSFTKFELFLEDSKLDTDWAAFSAAEKNARTFKHGDDTSTDTFKKMLKHIHADTVKKMTNKTVVLGADDETLAVKHYTAGKAARGQFDRIFRVPSVQTHAEAHAVALAIQDLFADGETFENITCVDHELDANGAWKNTNDLIYIENSHSSVDAKLKIEEITFDFSNDVDVKVKANPKTVIYHPIYIPRGIRSPAGDQEARAARKKQSVNEVSKLPGGSPLDDWDIPGVGSPAKRWDNDTDEVPYIFDQTKKRLSLVDAEDLSYVYTPTTPHIAIGNSNALPLNLNMQGELARKPATGLLDQETDTTARYYVYTVFTKDDFPALFAFPERIREVGLSNAAAGVMLSRRAFWVPPAFGVDLSSMPAGAVYYPAKWFFEGTRLFVVYITS